MEPQKSAGVSSEKLERSLEKKPEMTPPTPTVEEDSDDDDELDDFLDDFETPSIPATQMRAVKTEGQGAPQTDNGQPSSLDDDFARQLQLGMQDLLGEIQDSKELQDQFEHLVKELNDAATGGKATTSSSSAPKPLKAPANFQDRIKQTMERMKSSEAEVDAAVADSEGDDFLAEMLKQMQSAGGDGESDEDFSKMLLTMMEQLTSKEILYEPMRELADKYPEWLRKNEGKEPSEDIERYRDQYLVVKEIVAKFEEPAYRDENDKDRDYIIDRMQKMQAAGAPPTELMGEMGQGHNKQNQDSLFVNYESGAGNKLIWDNIVLCRFRNLTSHKSLKAQFGDYTNPMDTDIDENEAKGIAGPFIHTPQVKREKKQEKYKYSKIPSKHNVQLISGCRAHSYN
ncbi:uncharacterized protein LAJ45_11453 [Morchella importuna]|uniref:uncharacterized protein n=1 Tax=Morchella importuna TaxID=1174673 RepID=UPI001E8E1847|nr:uncharacterized protein LAJ45_11453 [Morchella importuna]KAH8144556.1 hypothetical protein LAJ45_11453 [Morchella importuna]